MFRVWRYCCYGMKNARESRTGLATSALNLLIQMRQGLNDQSGAACSFVQVRVEADSLRPNDP